MSEQKAELRPIGTITAEILIYKSQAGSAILEIGKRLIEAKDQMEHGDWLPWLKTVDFSERAAQRFMKLAREYSNPTLVSDLGATKALILLALPEEERETFAEETDAPHISADELRAAVQAKTEAENQAKGWELKYQQAQRRKEDADVELASLREALKKEQSRPQEVAVQTVDASAEQIAKAERKGKRAGKQEAEAALQEKITQAESRATEAEKAAQSARDALAETEKRLAAQGADRALVELNLELRRLQETKNSIIEHLSRLDDMTRQRTKAALKKVLTQMLEGL